MIGIFDSGLGGLVIFKEIKSPDDFKILADILAGSFGLSDKQINSILRTNVKDWIKSAIN